MRAVALSNSQLSNPGQDAEEVLWVLEDNTACYGQEKKLGQFSSLSLSQPISHTPQKHQPFRELSVRDICFYKEVLCLIMFPLVFVLRLYNTEKTQISTIFLLFNGISSFLGYFIPNQSFKKDSKSKVSDHSRGWPEGSLFDSYNTKVSTPFPGLLHFTLEPYLIMLSVKQGGIKFHF